VIYLWFDLYLCCVLVCDASSTDEVWWCYGSYFHNNWCWQSTSTGSGFQQTWSVWCSVHNNNHFLPFEWDYSGELVPEKHSPTHTYPDHPPSFISFLHQLRSVASSLLSLRAWQFLHNLSLSPLWLPLGWHLHFILYTFLYPIIVYFRNTCLYHRILFCCSTEIMSFIQFWHATLYTTTLLVYLLLTTSTLYWITDVL